MRCHLHYLTGRADERLTFDLQPEIAAPHGLPRAARVAGVERFMKHYYLRGQGRGRADAHLLRGARGQRRRKPRFGRPAVRLRPRAAQRLHRPWRPRRPGRSRDLFEGSGRRCCELFHVAQERDLDIHPAGPAADHPEHPADRQTLRDDPEANRLFMEMLTSPHDPATTLRRLNEAGVFGRFVPDFGRVVAQTQHDMYHAYTVDEHTIRAIGILVQIENGTAQGGASAVGRGGAQDPVAAGALSRAAAARHRQGPRRRSFGAGRRRGDAARAAARARATAETETVAWLVRYHLAMADTAFKRDTEDPKTIETSPPSCNRPSGCGCCWC